MKKITALLFALILAFSIVGCGTNTAQTPTNSPPASAATDVSDIASASPEASPSISSSQVATVELTIAAAASLTAPLNEVIANYTDGEPNVTIVANYGSSGKLQTQIENGAPTDIFFSAATKQMDALDSAGLMTADSIVKLLKNEIVLIVPVDSKLTIGKFEDAATDAVVRIALGDVKSVPAGQYAQDTFNFLNIWDQVSAKAVLGSDVKQVLAWVSSGDVDCGVVYKTDAVSDSTVKIIASAPADSHKAVIYPVGIIKASTLQDAAKDFITYLQSKDAMDVFSKFGFLYK